MEEPILSPVFLYTVISCIVISFVLSMMHRRSTSLRLAVFNRWGRWFSVSLGFAYIVFDAGWFNRPFWTIAIMFFLGWLLLETLYTWFAINALSQSDLSLFPRFSENDSGEEWPAQKKLIELKDWLKSKGFKRAQAVIAEVAPGMSIRSSVFQSEDDKIRFQILFIPQANGQVGYCYSFSSETENNERIVSDNLYMPYGGYYPDNWSVFRNPWCRSAATLFKKHKKRIESSKLANYETDPVADLNDQQRILEKTNLDAGFLVPHALREEQGRITWEGRYRVWKEVWLLNYFGMSAK